MYLNYSPYCLPRLTLKLINLDSFKFSANWFDAIDSSTATCTGGVEEVLLAVQVTRPLNKFPSFVQIQFLIDSMAIEPAIALQRLYRMAVQTPSIIDCGTLLGSVVLTISLLLVFLQTIFSRSLPASNLVTKSAS
ncbi:hypothetical protein B1A85_07580 [Chroococcidiopsis sp. TS-821]|nr:hypothetical protein B1A85_07580 [Chroococcidiopsis sp. TS-821]